MIFSLCMRYKKKYAQEFKNLDSKSAVKMPMQPHNKCASKYGNMYKKKQK